MKKLTCSCALAVLAFASALAAGGQWQTDYEKALAAAKAEDRPVFINFTGSDWCGPCIEFHTRVFSQKEFLDYADKHLVLIEIDYPKKKSLPNEIKQQNERLKSEFHINKLGFPTIALVDSSGKLLGTSTGYDDEKTSRHHWANRKVDETLAVENDLTKRCSQPLAGVMPSFTL